MKILVTGSNGLVGSHVAEFGVKAGHQMRAADIGPPPPHVQSRAPGAEFVTCDVRNREDCARAVESCDAIIHCAAKIIYDETPESASATFDVNVLGSRNLLELAQERCIRFVLLSSASLYGERPDLQPTAESDHLEPDGIYAATKQIMEIMITTYRRLFGVDAVSIRPGWVYGMGAAIGEYFLPRAFAGDSIVEPDGGDHVFDSTYVVDLAEALLKVATARTLPEPVYNVSGGVLRSRAELARIVCDLIPGARIEIGPGPRKRGHLRGPCKLDLAARDFGYAPRFSLEAGMKDWLERLRDARG